MKNFCVSSSLLFLFLLLKTTSAQEVTAEESDTRDTPGGHPWSYDDSTDIGPSKWSVHYPTCGLNRQSPIDIKATATVYQTALVNFTFSNYDRPPPSSFTLKNTGTTIQVDIDGKAEGISIAGGNLTEKYILHQLHFHWGQEGTEKGSEHLLDGTASSMEIHLVHWKEGYGSFDEAVKNSDGVAVLGVFVQAEPDPSLGVPELVNLTNYFGDIPSAGNTTSIPSFALSSLIPTNTIYYRYLGSLTTPACQESVIWTVFHNHIFLADSVINEYRRVFQPQMPFNYRPIQPLNGRVVYKNFIKP